MDLVASAISVGNSIVKMVFPTATLAANTAAAAEAVSMGAGWKGPHKRGEKQVTDIEDLSPGDHVVFKKMAFNMKFYEHHGIVISVHPDEGVFNVIEIMTTTNEDSGKTTAFVANRPQRFSEDSLVYVVEYEELCLPRSQVILHASLLAGTGEVVEYTNCEDYVTAIKTGSYKPGRKSMMY